MIVCIAEKPSVARDIAHVLGATTSHEGYLEGNGYQVTWTFGHLCELKAPEDYSPAWKRWSLGQLPLVPARFGIRLKADRGVERQFAVIQRLMQAAELIVNCGDAGQEGELIQRWVMQKAGATCPVKRLWISSLTEEAIRAGFAALKDQADYQPLYEAGLARAIGDWLLGMNATRLYTLKFGRQERGAQPLSVGRVQTPTLALIVRRGGGSFRDSLSLLDQISTLSDQEITADVVERALGLPASQTLTDLLQAYATQDTTSIHQILQDLLSTGLKPEIIASELITRILTTPDSALLPLLERLTSVQAPFPEAKLLLALLGPSSRAPESHRTPTSKPLRTPPSASSDQIAPVATPPVIQIGAINIELGTKSVTINGQSLPLTKKEFEILSLMAQNPGRIFSREDILNRVWQNDGYVLERTVDVHITRLRKKLGEYGKIIVNRSGYGYCIEL